jgi:hypothetical protein
MANNDLLLRPIAASPPGSGNAPLDPASVAYDGPKIFAIPIDAPNGGIADLGDDLRFAPQATTGLATRPRGPEDDG